MKKTCILLLALALCVPGILSADTEITVGGVATLGVEATTTFAWDLENNATGLETRAGMELIFPLFGPEDQGVVPEDTSAPTVRLLLENASFSWWNTFHTAGGNYEQDDFNSWVARPLILTFDTLLADVVWSNYFFRIASSTTTMRTNMITLRSIFDDVMDVTDRFYYSRNQALWRDRRYNIENFPLLGHLLNRNLLDIDYRNDISGILAGGGEFDRFGFTVKAASRFPGRGATEATSNTENAWLVGLDTVFIPVTGLRLSASGFAAFNYDQLENPQLSAPNRGRNPISFGVLGEYQMPLSDSLILVPFAGFDFVYDTVSEETEWEVGAGVMFHTRGFDQRTSSRVLDFDNVIPVGASIAMNINHDNRMNAVISWFDPAGRDSLIPNFGGFLQFELANLLAEGRGTDVVDMAMLAQFEYNINGRITPYIRGGWQPLINPGTATRPPQKEPDTYIIRVGIGAYLTLIQFFSIDIRYEMRNINDNDGFHVDRGIFTTAFTIRM